MLLDELFYIEENKISYFNKSPFLKIYYKIGKIINLLEPKIKINQFVNEIILDQK